MTIPGVSVVIPVYGCAETLPPLAERLTAVLAQAVDSFEIIFVDDRSTDAAWSVLADLTAADHRTRAIRLSRNFGQHLAITAGLAEALGQVAIVMDCDLQDPPELIPELLEAHRAGANIVYTRRRSTQRRPARSFVTHAYSWFLARLGGFDVDEGIGPFTLLARPVIDAFLQVGDRDRQFRYVLAWLGFESRTLDYDRPPRAAGRSSYSTSRLFALAVSGVIFSTTRVLNWTIYAGVALTLAGFGLATFYLVRFLVADVTPGFSILIAGQLLIGGLLMIAIGISALYVGRTFEQVRGRPLYVIEDRLDGMRPSESVSPPVMTRGRPK